MEQNCPEVYGLRLGSLADFGDLLHGAGASARRFGNLVFRFARKVVEVLLPFSPASHG